MELDDDWTRVQALIADKMRILVDNHVQGMFINSSDVLRGETADLIVCDEWVDPNKIVEGKVISVDGDNNGGEETSISTR